MRRRAHVLLSLVASAALGAGTLAVAGPPGSAAPADARSAATSRLTADATGGAATLRRAGNGDVTFVGTAAGGVIDNPSVSGSTSVADAAQAHLDRYGAALGVDRRGTSLVQRSVNHTQAGTDVVHFTQRIGGVPVVGGDVVVTLAADRDLVSMLSTMSTATSVPAAAQVSEDKAAKLAATIVARQGGEGVQVIHEGRWCSTRASSVRRPRAWPRSGASTSPGVSTTTRRS